MLNYGVITWKRRSAKPACGGLWQDLAEHVAECHGIRNLLRSDGVTSGVTDNWITPRCRLHPAASRALALDLYWLGVSKCTV